MMETRTRNTRWRRSCLRAALVAALCLGAPGAGQALSFDLAADGDFGPINTSGPSLTATKDGFTLTLEALSMTPEDEIDLENGDLADLIIGQLGMGVRPSMHGGSIGISGNGAHRDEVLIFGFSSPVVTSSVTLVLTQFGPSSQMNSMHGDLAEVYITEDQVLPFLVPIAGEDGTFLLPLTGLLPEDIDWLAIRAVNGHFLVSGIQLTAIPEPSTLVLVGIGLLGLRHFGRDRARLEIKGRQ